MGTMNKRKTTSCFSSSSFGPIPECMRMSGDITAPADRITSLLTYTWGLCICDTFTSLNMAHKYSKEILDLKTLGIYRYLPCKAVFV